MTLLTFNSKYVVSSTNAVSTASTSLVDDTEATQTFILAGTQVVLAIYQANSTYANGIESDAGTENAISVDGTDRALSYDSAPATYRAVRNCSFWIGTLAAGSHTIKGRFAVNGPGSAVVNNRVLLIYIFDGDEFQYVDDATLRTTTSFSLVDDLSASVTFTPSGACKLLCLYNITNLHGATEYATGKKAAISIAGVDHATSAKSSGSAKAESICTFYGLSCTAISTTVKGRFSTPSVGETVSINRRQLGVLLLADATLLNLIDSAVQVTTTSNVLVDDTQALISRTTTGLSELLVVAVGTVTTPTTTRGECYGIKIDANDRANSRGTPKDEYNSNSAATAYAEQLAAGAHTVQGRFSNNYGTDSAVVNTRQVVALWFGGGGPGPSVNPKGNIAMQARLAGII
jgi:hypothetical protein